MISDIRQPVGRPKINEEQTPARFPAGTLARIDSVLEAGEKRSDLIREAIEREINRRERAKAKD
ncbi:YlcI/YnfO family protein [Mesorhizobium sp.]|uniref:YlcI/YnfO family protein n=1 Tax=Mesorhizobium sp. TaxID=1871066 RepID=UPI00338FF4C2